MAGKLLEIDPAALAELGSAVEWYLSKVKRESVSSPVGLKITRDGSSYEIHAPFDVWDGYVDGEQRWCAEFSQTISSR